MLRTDVLPPGFEPAARVRGRWRAQPQVFRTRARGSEPGGSASQTRTSNTLRNISYLLSQSPAFVQWEKDHGRTEERRVRVSQHLDLVEETADWAGLPTLV